MQKDIDQGKKAEKYLEKIKNFGKQEKVLAGLDRKKQLIATAKKKQNGNQEKRHMYFLMIFEKL